jgi:hypothetical protein
MCGIEQAIEHIKADCVGMVWAQDVIARLEYHRKQAQGIRPNYHEGMTGKDYYTCGNCGVKVEITDNFCRGCGYMIKWDSIRCLTGLPLADMAEREG